MLAVGAGCTRPGDNARELAEWRLVNQTASDEMMLYHRVDARRNTAHERRRRSVAQNNESRRFGVVGAGDATWGQGGEASGDTYDFIDGKAIRLANTILYECIIIFLKYCLGRGAKFSPLSK